MSRFPSNRSTDASILLVTAPLLVIATLLIALLTLRGPGVGERAHVHDHLRQHAFQLHPVYQHLSEMIIEPVIVNRYSFRNQAGAVTSEGGLFKVGGATFQQDSDTDSSPLFCKNADVLLVPQLRSDSSKPNYHDYVTVQLNRPARVYVLLMLKAKAKNRLLESTPLGWVSTMAVLEHGSLDKSLVNHSGTPHALAVQVPVPTDFILRLPHYKRIGRAGDRTIRGMAIVFAPINSTGFPLGPHPFPRVPKPYQSLLHPSVTDDPSLDIPIPNESCPSWLHDLYVTKRSWNEHYWRTWHPPIDPIYWCYFDHEHGAYPGHFYRPLFHLTAHHTPDNTTESGHQDESHNGFKVFAFDLDDGRFMVLTLHAHNSQARRFYTRHHTMVVSVHRKNAGGWTTELELHMKADFGVLRGIFSRKSRFEGRTGPFTQANMDIERELSTEANRHAFRTVNVINVDHFPESLDPDFKVYRDPTRPRKQADSVLGGRYESWHGRLNCVHNAQRPSASGLKFEFHQVQTAMKDPYSTSPDNLQVLNGNGMGRAIVFGNSKDCLQISADSCVFDGNTSLFESRSDGAFYTDAYFGAVVAADDSRALHQFMVPDFQPAVVGCHRAVTNDDAWNERMSYSANMAQRLNNMEVSINRPEN